MNFNLKNIAMVLVAFAMVLGLNSEAKAWAPGATDTFFVLDGNGTDYVLDLGSAASILAGTAGNGANQWTIDATSLGQVVTAGTPTHWQIVGFDSTLFYNTVSTAGTISSGLSGAQGAVAGWLPFIPVSNTNPFTTVGTSLYSYSGNVDTAGDGSLGSNVAYSTSATITAGGNSMRLMSGDYSGAVVTEIKNAMAAITGYTAGHTITLTISPSAVPLPASVVLFGTGVIALMIISRRRTLFV
jgi:hypothetical protein